MYLTRNTLKRQRQTCNQGFNMNLIIFLICVQILKAGALKSLFQNFAMNAKYESFWLILAVRRDPRLLTAVPVLLCIKALCVLAISG